MHKDGVVSVWLALELGDTEEDIDVLKDLCGVESYDVDRNEGYASPSGAPISVKELIDPLSYSKSYVDGVVSAALQKGFSAAVWSVAQYNFAYDPAKTVGDVSNELVFIGYFPYKKEARRKPEGSK